jgi:hypothetical protein
LVGLLDEALSAENRQHQDMLLVASVPLTLADLAASCRG